MKNSDVLHNCPIFYVDYFDLKTVVIEGSYFDADDLYEISKVVLSRPVSLNGFVVLDSEDFNSELCETIGNQHRFVCVAFE